MQNQPVQQTVQEIIREYTKYPVNMGSKLAKDLVIYEFDVSMIRLDLESAFGIEIDQSEAVKWKKVKNVVAIVNVLINRLEK